MTQNALYIENVLYNPLESVEQFILSKDWPSERLNEYELLACIQGNWCNYQSTFSWDEQGDLFHIAVSFEIGLPRTADFHYNSELNKLLLLANEQLVVGHFDLWREENAIVWRYGLPMRGLSVDADYIEHLVTIAMDACERYFAAFQYVLWGGEEANHMLHVSMFETVGTA
jgi:hypothetical protein